MTQKRRGRPTGFKMTMESKQKTAKSMTGKKCSLQTRLKISQSIIKFWEEKDHDKGTKEKD